MNYQLSRPFHVRASDGAMLTLAVPRLKHITLEDYHKQAVLAEIDSGSFIIGYFTLELGKAVIQQPDQPPLIVDASRVHIRGIVIEVFIPANLFDSPLSRLRPRREQANVCP